MQTYQGRLSSASTGKFAALLLPLALVLLELKITSSLLSVGPSTSMSSSKSDILMARCRDARSEYLVGYFFETMCSLSACGARTAFIETSFLHIKD